MPGLIVVQIVPQAPVDAMAFQSYLTGLTIEAFDLSFTTVDSSPPGASVGTASYIAATGWSPVAGHPDWSSSAPSYPGVTPTSSGIVQQVDFVVPGWYYQYESVAIAVIYVSTSAATGNFRLEIKSGGQTLVTIPYQYQRSIDPVGTPDPAGWTSVPGDPNQVSSWAALPVDTYVSVPASTTATVLQLPDDGTPPSFDKLLNAVEGVLAVDPGAIPSISTTAAAAAGATSLSLSSVADVSVGMAVAGAGVPSGTTVTAVGPGSSITLSQEVTGVASGAAITFTPNLATLTVQQCKNIAYEIVWGQQPPLPSPADPVEDLYTNPPNTGSMLSSGSTPNSYESDRQQFEGQLQSYYAVADTKANQLATFVYALSAAIACEEQSIAATQALLQFPVDPGGGASPSEASVILTGLANAGVAGNFGAPAAYFYALAATMPVQITSAQRFTRATSDQLSRLLTDLTTAINAGTVTDSEACYSLPAVTINAAQAARRISALGVSAGSATPLAPLGAVASATSADAAAGTALTFVDTAGVASTMLVSGAGIAPDTTVQSVAGATVTLTKAIVEDVVAGSVIVFTPSYTATPGLQTLITSWLAYPPGASGTPSSEAYQPTDDAAKLWPQAATASSTAEAYLNLVLVALTHGYVIPAPFGVALGTQIESFLAGLPGAPSPPTVATLASVTVEQWTGFFQQQPTWLPPFTEPGNTAARIAAFIAFAQNLFAVSTSGPPSEILLVTDAPTPAGGSLPFPSTAGIANGMRVTGPGIPAGATVTAVTPTDVSITPPVGAGGVPDHTTITFMPVVTPAGATPGPPLLDAPSVDWLADCLSSYGAFTWGTGFDETKLRAAAATVFPGDPDAQAWLLDALDAIDALDQLVPSATPQLEFSMVEALYAHGFRSAADVTQLDGDAFREALIGTVAFDSAAAIYSAAAAIAPPEPEPSPAGGFTAVNPDGELTDCIPAACASPLGPTAYLHELLGLSALSTCEAVVAEPISLTTTAAAAAGDTVLSFASAAGVLDGMSASASGIDAATTVSSSTPTSVTLSQPLSGSLAAGTTVVFSAPTLADVTSPRRGTLGDLAASAPNLETPLPLIDIVNECLEYLGAAATPIGGTVYDTSADAVAGHVLCAEERCPDDDKAARCHDPARLLAVLPEYSTPAVPVAADAAVEPAVFNKLKADFSSCLLPYSQALDVSRTYLGHLGSCRFEEMRTFRRCITEFVLDPVNEPAGFQPSLWRYPVRIDIAIEYLGITPEEYATVFAGAPAPPCAAGEGGDGDPAAPELRALASREGIVGVPAFLTETCLTYCELYELWQSGFVAFGNGGDERTGEFPQCEPCCLEDLWLEFPDESQRTDLAKLLVFVRLWRKLRETCCFCYSFAELRDICDVLQLYSGGTLNPDFVRQLAAFQMLRDELGMDLVDPADPSEPGAVDADRTHLLALWVGPGATKWGWAVQQLIERVEQHARRRHDRQRRSPHFIKLLVDNLDPLSRLAGFDPTSASDSWHALPTHTLRFAEVLAKIYASDFSVGELIYLFTAGEHLDGDDPFPLQEANEALDLPLGLPDDERDLSLWRLREQVLAVEVGEEEREAWPWRRIEAALQEELGFAASDVAELGQHFFPGVLAESGAEVSPAATRFVSSLAAASTSAATWNTPPDGPLEYDSSAQQLSMRLPLSDRALIRKLTHVHDLSAAEREALQDLFFQPRAMLARFALLFSDIATAQRRLIEEPEERERFAYFRHQFLLCIHRSRIIARRLSRHVASATGQEAPEGDAAARLILRTLAADENAAQTSWEDDTGAMPPLTWTPPPNGSALAALLGLAGTGLLAEFRTTGGDTAWRDASGPLSGFGAERDHENCPVPTVLPSFDATLTPEQLQFASVHNGFLMKDATDAWLGGAQGFAVTWTGALLVERDGTYEFWAGAPTPGDERPDFEAAEHRRWRIVIRRGQRSWVLLSHHWSGEEEQRAASLPLKRGAYELTVEFVQPDPEFENDEQLRAQHTGFQVKYRGADSDGQRVEIPHSRLFMAQKDETLADGIDGLSAGAAAYLRGLYLSSLRDIRRTYQRAFKALLFAHRFALSAHRHAHATSELAYMLSQPARFAGVGYYRGGGGFVSHAANFDFDFLPLLDDYHSPTQDARTAPSPQRIQALFDWWERMFDYGAARAEVRRRCGRHLWHLFEEAQEKQPPDPASLLRHMGADSRHWELELRYFQGQAVPVYGVTSADLEDDRWTLRAWHADSWLRALQCSFASKEIAVARPDLWASDDPSAVVPGETETGNANLSAFVCDGCLENGEPRRYDALRDLNDQLRERGRRALIAYLCHMDRVALPWRPGQFATAARDLSDLLLLDVEAGMREKASRIEEAITAVQSYVRRARLGLEPGWTLTPAFARLWDREFVTLRVWQACKRRQLYKENWVEWDELEKARGIEAFRFLEDRLRDPQLTIPAPGGLEWWPDQRPRQHEGLELLQQAESSRLRRLDPGREGLSLLGVPDRSASPSWLAPLAQGKRTQPRDGVAAAADAIADPAGAPAEAQAPEPGADTQTLPYWLQTAIRLGVRFWRIDAAGAPPAAGGFAAHPRREDCVTCCEECGCAHPPTLDEYYFWLVDGTYYEPPVTPTETGFTAPAPGDYQNGYQADFYDPSQQEAALWQDPTQLPQLLQWEGSPMVRLAWCRVHNGEFQQPRRSTFGVAVTPGADADLTFLGRTADSLTFSVSDAIAPTGFADPSAPGFRYDMAVDEAVVLPQVSAPPPPPSFLGTLPAYPYFVYFTPGAELFPLTPFAPALAVAGALRSHCRFEAALQWYRLAFDPLHRDCTWIECERQSSGDGQERLDEVPAGVAVAVPPRNGNGHTSQGACCDSTDISCAQARDRAALLHYLDTMVEWGDALRRRGDDREAFEQARVVFDAAGMILGGRPRTVRLPAPETPPAVSDFTPELPPLNPRLMHTYDTVEDRLRLTHAAVDARRLQQGRHGSYFGDSPLRQGWRSDDNACADALDWCYLPSPYRFGFLIEKAQEYAAKVEQLGSALLAAFEKGDAELLAALRSGQEVELLRLGLDAKKDQWRDADWQVEALQTGKSVSQANLAYTNQLINAGPGGLIDGEIQYQNLTNSALSLRGTADVIEGVGEAMRLIPDLVMGAAGFGGTPVSIAWIPLGTKVGDALEAVARIINNSAEIDSITAELDQTDASWLRRLNEWIHQAQVLAIEIHQTERQILGAQRRRDQALVDLNTQRRQIEQSEEVQSFVRDKFSAQDLYLFLQSETLALYRRTYDLARYAARQAERAFNLERGHTTRHFIPDCAWGDLHEGLLAGERLSSALRHMEQAYHDENVREYELTKNLSLRLHFPLEFLRLRTTGRCEIEIPEWMFDLDSPGMYMRRIKSVSLTIPAVTGPYTGVHCRLTLTGSTTRIEPLLRAPAHECCCPPEPCECDGDAAEREYELCPDDPRAVRQHDARQAIATSTGQNDSGLFELNFEDPRYLPFEYMGAVSRWRIELPPENNYFDFDTLSDAIIRLNYTAREGGEPLRQAANASAQRHLPGDGWHFFDVRHDFADAWERLRGSWEREHDGKVLKLRLSRRLFPFVPGGRDVWIDKMAVAFGASDDEPCECGGPADCPCPPHRKAAEREIDFVHGRGDAREHADVRCFADDGRPGLYCGVFDTRLGPVDGHHPEFELRFPADTRWVEHLFLLCRYRVHPPRAGGPRPVDDGANAGR